MARLAPKSIVIETDYRLPRAEWIAQEERQLEAAAARAKREASGDLVGERLRWQRADGYAVYMVVSERPLVLAHVDIGDGYAVEGALIRGLHLAEVRQKVEHARALEAFFQKGEQFYEELERGSIVHYHDGFGQFIRCEVVEDTREDAKKGALCLKKIALVGRWKQHDLRVDSRQRKGIREGRLFRPNAGCVYENPASEGGAQAYGDPSQLEPLGVSGQQPLFG